MKLVKHLFLQVHSCKILVDNLKKTEERIAVLETRNQEIDELMTQEDIYSNSVKCQELAIEKSSNEEELETLYEQWADLAEE